MRSPARFRREILLGGTLANQVPNNHYPDSIMSQPNRNSISWISVLPSLIIPICLGLTLFTCLLAMIRHGVLENEIALRYLTGHPISELSVAMFLIGASSLLMIAINIFSQFASERDLRFTPLSDSDFPDASKTDDEEAAVALGQQLLDYPQSVQSHYLWQRLTNSLLYVYRNGSAAGVDDEVKHLAELDFDQQQQRYSLVRILIWATPMLGFLGTVLGISQALGGISVGADNDFESMMNGLRGSLYVAFDTTALALTLSMVLMFAQFLVDRFETQLLAVVDQRTRSEIYRQFESASGSTDEDSVERLGQHLLLATREMMMTQTDIWKRTISSAEQAWASSLTETSERVRSSWAESVESTVAQLTEGIDRSVAQADESMSRRWKQWQVMLSDNARLMSQQQQELAAQTTSLQSLVGKTQNEHAAADALQGALKAIATTEKLTTAIDSLSQRVDKLSVAPATGPSKKDSRVASKVMPEVSLPEPKLTPKLRGIPKSRLTPVSRVMPKTKAVPESKVMTEADVMKKLLDATSKKNVPVKRRGSESGPAHPVSPIVPRHSAAMKDRVAPSPIRKLEDSQRGGEVVLPIGPHLAEQKIAPRDNFLVVTRSNSKRKFA